jgi:hypothetical protein
MSKARWISVWHQLHEVLQLKPCNILEIGPGIGLFKASAVLFDVVVETLDPDPALKPDYVASVTNIPLPNCSHDVVCAFQVLEHLPYEQSVKSFQEMARVSRKYVIISLPDALRVWRYELHIPRLGVRTILMPRPSLRLLQHNFDGQHYWEINVRDYPLKRIIDDLSVYMKLEKHYLVPENPRHRFFVFRQFS